MIPFILLFLINLTTFDAPKNNPVMLKKYISENAKIYCRAYWINEDIPDVAIDVKEQNIVENSELEFLKKLQDKYAIEYHLVGSYYFFNRKQP